jgi:hypothetical protein
LWDMSALRPVLSSSRQGATYNRICCGRRGTAARNPSLCPSTHEGDQRQNESLLRPSIQLCWIPGRTPGLVAPLDPDQGQVSEAGKAFTRWPPGWTLWSTGPSIILDRRWCWYTWTCAVSRWYSKWAAFRKGQRRADRMRGGGRSVTCQSRRVHPT